MKFDGYPMHQAEIGCTPGLIKKNQQGSCIADKGHDRMSINVLIQQGSCLADKGHFGMHDHWYAGELQSRQRT